MFREPERNVWSVSDLVEYLYTKLNMDEQLQKIWLEGEITNFSRHSKSRHMYFTIKDERAAIDAVMFAGNNRRLRFQPKNGDRVLVRGYVSLYMKDGHLQMYVQDMRLSGMGDLYVAFQRLKEQLMTEGLFDQPKKPLPKYPRKVGVITSASGAAVRDIIVTIKRRYPIASILLYPVPVQGDQAASQIARAIDRMNELNEADVIIVGRGGGSLEELWAFNEEVVARSIHRSLLPVVSAVGHETDFTISDLVADRRAPTPTAAAELVVPQIEELRNQVKQYTHRLIKSQFSLLVRLKDRFESKVNRAVFKDPKARLYQYTQRLDHMETRLEHTMHRILANKDRRLGEAKLQLKSCHPAQELSKLNERLSLLIRDCCTHMAQQVKTQKQMYQHQLAQLDALSPLRVMQRGYSLVYRFDSDQLVKSARQMKSGDLIRVRLADGQLKCQVWRSEGENDE
ncbi:exodeoxyribonuclease VII large subunit [Thermoactinomyces mirandus]|uniref:Exodeoxyribonuclease 7 large subunit n=1 Tax=Thermoactinomyces mirandus TaxID=2756294 RepID=A0A7W1XPQ8_9BACL|nr:exodeoxyribonuclease VII large subunit [Thermoactinomyces mirandus]MBA4600911.1 exodeoxyribonuclease VII large subunit [Thermoactinomyces mirandus]